MIVGVLTFWISDSTVKANEAIYYHMFSKGAPSLAHSQIVVDTINESKNFKINLRHGLVCSAKEDFNKQKDLALIEFINYRVWQSLQEANDECNFDLKNVRYLSVQPYHYNLCVLNDSAIKTAADLRNQKTLRFGNGGGMGKYLVNQFTNKNGLEWTQQNYPNSGAAALALIAGEVDVAYLYSLVSGRQEATGKVRCLSYGDPKHEKATEKLLAEIHPILSSYSMMFITGVKNANDAQYKQLLDSVLLAEKSVDAKFKDNRLMVVGKDITEKELATLVKNSTEETFKITKNFK